MAIWETNTASTPEKSSELRFREGGVELVHVNTVVWTNDDGPLLGLTLDHLLGLPMGLTEGSNIWLVDLNEIEFICDENGTTPPWKR